MKLLVFSAVGFCLAQVAIAKTMFYGSERENLTVSYETETLFRFDEEVKTITQAENFEIKPADAENPDFRIISVRPRTPTAHANLTFILANDNIVNIRLTTVKSTLHATTNTFYDLKAKKEQLSPSFGKPQGSNVTEVELMKAMIRKDNIVGYNIRNLNQNVRTGIKGVSAKLLTVYTGPMFHGYIFKIINQQEKSSVAIDIKSLLFGRPNIALLSQVDQSIVETNKETLLRIVSKPSSTFRAVTLPISPILKK
ncbi:MAG: hypothetical protein HRU09_14260 [Oligoflexales bacterium]|nr:hypothetical protein [Oligoflexales bacterium]